MMADVLSSPLAINSSTRFLKSKDFVTMAVKQFYIVVMSSAKEELSQYNLYDYANKVDDLLLNINQCIENEDTVSLTQYHKQIDELLDKFIYIN